MITAKKNNLLEKKIQTAIKTIQKGEKLALKYQDFGYHLAFSGGKDSQVILELTKMAGVKFKPFFYKTSVDPPELLKFIRKSYPEVKWIKPEMTMFQLIMKKGMLPLRQARYCCEVIKERQGLDSVVMTGIRKTEGNRRKSWTEFKVLCKLGKDKPIFNPILEWTLQDVFEFLKIKGIELCELYKIFDRIGCIGCPMNCKSQRKEFALYPNFRKAYINTIQKLRDEKGKYLNFDSAEDALNWWTSGISVKEYKELKKQLKFDYNNSQKEKQP